MNLQNAVHEQAQDVRQILEKAGGRYFIEIKDNLCAICFKKYAKRFENTSTEFKVVFDDAKNVEVSLKHFLNYHFFFTETARYIESTFGDEIDSLRDLQNDEIEKLFFQNKF